MYIHTAVVRFYLVAVRKRAGTAGCRSQLYRGLGVTNSDDMNEELVGQAVH